MGGSMNLGPHPIPAPSCLSLLRDGLEFCGYSCPVSDQLRAQGQSPEPCCARALRLGGGCRPGADGLRAHGQCPGPCPWLRAGAHLEAHVLVQTGLLDLSLQQGDSAGSIPPLQPDAHPDGLVELAEMN